MSRPLGHLNNISIIIDIVKRIFNILFFITVSHNCNFHETGIYIVARRAQIREWLPDSRMDIMLSRSRFLRRRLLSCHPATVAVMSNEKALKIQLLLRSMHCIPTVHKPIVAKWCAEGTYKGDTRNVKSAWTDDRVFCWWNPEAKDMSQPEFCSVKK